MTEPSLGQEYNEQEYNEAVWAMVHSIRPGWHVVKLENLGLGNPDLDFIIRHQWCKTQFGAQNETVSWQYMGVMGMSHVWLFQNQEDAAEFALICA